MSRVIIADASCLIALDRIGELRILKALYSEIVTTIEVQKEFGKEFPEWISIEAAKNTLKRKELEQILDAGEATCIALAIENPHSLLIIDEKKGRKVASNNRLEIIGTLGVLLLAKKKSIIPSVKDKINFLAQHKFRFNQAVVTKLLTEGGEL